MRSLGWLASRFAWIDEVPAFDAGGTKTKLIQGLYHRFRILRGGINQEIQIECHADKTVFGDRESSANGIRNLVAVEDPQQLFHIIGQIHAGCGPRAGAGFPSRFGR